MNDDFLSRVEPAVAQLDATNAARESALVTSRSLIRQCANAIRAIHRHEWPDAEHCEWCSDDRQRAT